MVKKFFGADDLFFFAGLLAWLIIARQFDLPDNWLVLGGFTSGWFVSRLANPVDDSDDEAVRS